jgi:hypothetical protein
VLEPALFRSEFFAFKPVRPTRSAWAMIATRRTCARVPLPDATPVFAGVAPAEVAQLRPGDGTSRNAGGYSSAPYKRAASSTPSDAKKPCAHARPTTTKDLASLDGFRFSQREAQLVKEQVRVHPFCSPRVRHASNPRPTAEAPAELLPFSFTTHCFRSHLHALVPMNDADILYL